LSLVSHVVGRTNLNDYTHIGLKVSKRARTRKQGRRFLKVPPMPMLQGMFMLQGMPTVPHMPMLKAMPMVQPKLKAMLKLQDIYKGLERSLL